MTGEVPYEIRRGEHPGRSPLVQVRVAPPCVRPGAWRRHLAPGAATWPAPAPRPTGLPFPPTWLIGRERELAEVTAALLREDVRLLTLTGPAGVGKTRLALEAARGTRGDFADGVWLVDLAPLRDAGAVLSAIARGLGVREVGDRPLGATLKATLGGRRLLLVLDNFEHLLEAGPQLAELLAAGPAFKLLVTSRSRLRLRTEHTLPVAPLAVPDDGAPATVESLRAVPAVALFVARARASDAAFALTESNAADVASLTVHLDGLPLALELAAARAHVLSPAQMLRWAEHRLPVLDWDAPDVPARQRSLRAALAWSYALLSPAEQTLFRRLAVFAGGWTLKAAAAVTGMGQLGLEPVTGLTRLVDASLVRSVGRGGPGRRLHLLETLREFAEEQLERSGEAEAVRSRHAAYYTALAERAAIGLEGPEQRAWFARLERERANLRAALYWAALRGEAEVELRLAGSLGYFWWSSGSLREGRAWLADALAQNPGRRDGLRQQALEGAGLLEAWLGEDAAAEAWLAEALDLARELDDGRRIMRVLGKTAAAAVAGGRFERAPAIIAQVEVTRQAADPWSLGFAARYVGLLALEAGESRTAAAYLEEALAWCRRAGDRAGEIRSLASLALAAQASGAPDRAAALVAEALPLAGEPGPSQALLWWCAFVAAWVSLGRAPAADLARVLGAADALRAGPLTPHRQAQYDQTIAAVRSASSEAAFAPAWSDGRAMMPDDLIDATLAALERRPRPPPAGPATGLPSSPTTLPAQRPPRPAPNGTLSPREQEVLHLVADGATNKQVATALVVTVATARYHVASLLNKLGAANRTQAVALARQRGLL